MNINFQSPQKEEATPAIIGPKKEDTALINCPKVSTLVTLSGFTTRATIGFKDTCKIVFPIPSKANANKIQAKS